VALYALYAVTGVKDFSSNIASTAQPLQCVAEMQAVRLHSKTLKKTKMDCFTFRVRNEVCADHHCKPIARSNPFQPLASVFSLQLSLVFGF
jgi:hypothetical protein